MSIFFFRKYWYVYTLSVISQLWDWNSSFNFHIHYHFTDDISKCIFKDNVWISIKIPLKFVPKGLINNIPALVQMMVWRRSGDKPMSGPMLVILLTHMASLGLSALRMAQKHYLKLNIRILIEIPMKFINFEEIRANTDMSILVYWCSI